MGSEIRPVVENGIEPSPYWVHSLPWLTTGDTMEQVQGTEIDSTAIGLKSAADLYVALATSKDGLTVEEAARRPIIPDRDPEPRVRRNVRGVGPRVLAPPHVANTALPADARPVAMVRDGQVELVQADTMLAVGDDVLAISGVASQDELKRLILGDGA